MAMAYYQALEGLVSLIWNDFYFALKDRGTFDGTFKEYNFIWIGPSIYIALHIFFLIVLRKKAIGNLELVVGQLHGDCHVPGEYFFPMLIHSLLCLSTGCGVSQESPLVVLGASMSSFLGQLFQLETRSLRIFVISGVAATLSGYFGAPITGIFALEMLHRMGFEFFEVYPAVVVSTFIGATVMQAIFGTHYGGAYIFPPGLTDINPLHFIYGLLLGIAGAVFGSLFIFMTRFYNWVHRKLDLGLWKIPLPLIAWVIFSGVGMMLPQILFWGHPELQSIIDLNVNATNSHWQGGNSGVFQLPTPLTSGIVFAIGFTKLAILPLMFALNMKGGIVFALFAIGGILGQGIAMITGIDQALAVFAVMAATQSVVTRTPLSSALVCLFNGKNIAPQLLIPIFAASFFANLITLKVVMIPSQRARTDFSMVSPPPVKPDTEENPMGILPAEVPDPREQGNNGQLDDVGKTEGVIETPMA